MLWHFGVGHPQTRKCTFECTFEKLMQKRENSKNLPVLFSGPRISYTGICIFFTHVPKFQFVVLFVHAPDGIDRYVFRVLVWQRTNTYFFNIVRMVIVHVATCWMSLTMVTCKSIEMVKLTVTVFIYHETETLRNEFSNRSTVSLVGKPLVSRAGQFQGKPL